MASVHTSSDDSSFFNLPQARWTVRILGLLIAALGKDSLLGLILRQTRSEIASIVRDEEPETASAEAVRYKNN